MKMHYMKFTTLLLGLLAVGCFQKENIQDEHEQPVIQDEQYLRCNETSFGIMSEVEDGYFYIDNQVLFYADKSDLSTWVPVCNKPDCLHSNIDACKAYTQSVDRFIQKNGKLYGITYELFEGIYVYEMDTAGSGRTKVYTLPDTDNFTGGMSYYTSIFADHIVVSYDYLDEKGFTQIKIVSVEMNEKGKFETKTLMESEGERVNIMQANSYWKIRGDKDLVMTNFQLEEGELFTNNFFDVKDGFEKVDIGEDISPLWGYFADDTFTYYEQNEGFYEVNLNTGEKTLLFANQIENAKGYVLSEDYMLECNRYIDYKPEEAYLKFYNGEEWFDIELPAEVKNSDNPFYLVGIASDKIFLNHNVNKGDEYDLVTTLYSIDLKEEPKELIYCGEVGLNAGLQSEEETVEETIKEIVEETEVSVELPDEFEDVIVFDTEDIFLKITDVYVTNSRYCIDMYAENKSDMSLSILGNYCAINGIQCNTLWGDDLGAGKTATFTMEITKYMLEDYNIKDIYNMNEYTDIEINFKASSKYDEIYEETYIHIYPQGEENVVSFTREPQSTDQVLVENEYVSIIVTGYGTGYVPGDTIYVVLQNKSDESVIFKAEEGYANGIEFEVPDGRKHQGLYYVKVNPGKYTLYSITLFDDTLGLWNQSPSDAFFISHHITSVEEIEMLFRAYPCNYRCAEIGEDFVNETFVLYPNVEE